MTTTTATTAATTPNAEKVLQLQAVRGYPAVSLLLSTTPAPAMTPGDVQTLRALHAQAVDRLARDVQAGDTARLLDRLERLVHVAADSPTGHAMAVFAHRSTGSIVRLPVTVTDRTVVDPTFATRDLVRALHRTPYHLVLSLTRVEARLFAGTDTLHPVRASAFPVTAPHAPRRSATRPALAAGDTTTFLRAVDAAFGTYRRVHPAPFVITGEDRVLSEFERISRNLDRCAGTLRVNTATEPLSRVAARTRPLLEAYLLSRQDEALALLGTRIWADRAAVGLPAVWLAARHDRPEMLAVEQGLFQAARISPDGDTLDLVHDPAEVADDPDVVDDIIDDLIELVLHRGGWVALLDDGRLTGHGGIALTLRRT